MNKLGNNEKIMHTTNEVGAVDKGEKRMSVEGPVKEEPY